MHREEVSVPRFHVWGKAVQLLPDVCLQVGVLGHHAVHQQKLEDLAESVVVWVVVFVAVLRTHHTPHVWRLWGHLVQILDCWLQHLSDSARSSLLSRHLDLERLFMS